MSLNLIPTLSLLLITRLPRDLVPYSSSNTATRHFSARIFLFSPNSSTEQPSAITGSGRSAVPFRNQLRMVQPRSLSPWATDSSPLQFPGKGLGQLMLFRDESRQGGVTDTPKGCAARQRDPAKLEKQARGTLRRSANLERNSPMCRAVTGKRAALQEKSPHGIGVNNM